VRNAQYRVLIESTKSSSSPSPSTLRHQPPSHPLPRPIRIADLAPISNGDNLVNHILSSLLQEEFNRGPVLSILIPHSVIQSTFFDFSNSTLASWKESLKQQGDTLFMVCGGGGDEETMIRDLDIGDHVEPIPSSYPSHSHRNVVDASLEEDQSTLGWFQAACTASHQFSLNIKQYYLLFLIACGLCSALPEGGTSKRLITLLFTQRSFELLLRII